MIKTINMMLIILKIYIFTKLKCLVPVIENGYVIVISKGENVVRFMSNFKELSFIAIIKYEVILIMN